MATTFRTDRRIPLEALRDANNTELLALIANMIQSEQELGILSVFFDELLLANTEIPSQSEFDPPLYSVQLINDGAGAFSWQINNSGQRFRRVNFGEVDTLTFRLPKIKKLYLRTLAGATPTIRITGIQ